MLELLKKIQLFQFIIIIIFLIMSSKKSDIPYIDRKDPYYNFLLNIVDYNNIFYKKILKNEVEDIFPNFLEKNEYFYFFHNKYNVSAYFFKEINSDIHTIHFNGINKMNELKLITKILYSNFRTKNIEKLLDKEGILYKVLDNNKIEKIDDFISIFDQFDYMKNTYYNLSEINLKINGYSLGGPLSQIFIHLILEKYPDDSFNIENYNIETWFSGSKDEYENFNKLIKVYNIYNKKSILYFYNIIFQKYFQVDNFIENDIDQNKFVEESIFRFFPNGIIKYINDNHILSKLVQKKGT
jgi:hypothetical protein